MKNHANNNVVVGVHIHIFIWKIDERSEIRLMMKYSNTNELLKLYNIWIDETKRKNKICDILYIHFY